MDTLACIHLKSLRVISSLILVVQIVVHNEIVNTKSNNCVKAQSLLNVIIFLYSANAVNSLPEILLLFFLPSLQNPSAEFKNLHLPRLLSQSMWLFLANEVCVIAQGVSLPKFKEQKFKRRTFFFFNYSPLFLTIFLPGKHSPQFTIPRSSGVLQ